MGSEYMWGKEAGEAEAGNSKNNKGVSADCFWNNMTGGNLFRGGDGILKFRELYTGKRRRDRNAWSDYFLSGIFLKSWREETFTKLMWEIVRDHQSEYLPCKEFLTELYIAYGLQKVGDEFHGDSNAAFPGIEYILEIAKLGPAIRNFKKNDPAMQAGFRDYRELLALSVNEAWDDDLLLRLGKVIDYYNLHNLSDRPINNAYQYDLTWRHPKSLKLITWFFQHTDLPNPVYRVLWNHLRLDTATNGREKLLYGELRETVLARLPELGEKERISYRQILKDFNRYGTGTSHFFNDGRTVEERNDLDQFFDQEEVQDALLDEAFVEEQVIHYWINANSGSYLLFRLQGYYENHRNAPYAEKILLQIHQIQEQRKIQEAIQKALLEDEQSEFSMGSFDFRKRAYVRYYLNTAFHLARGLQKKVLLPEYLAEHMPYSIKWSRDLINPEKSGLFVEHPIEIQFGQNILGITFHLRHLEYHWNNSRRVPYFPGEKLEQIEDDTQFWLLAPIAAAPYKAHLAVCSELMKRLSRLPVPEADVPVIADCITGKICRLEEDDFPVCSLYAEKGEQLFGCDIHKDGTLILYEEEAVQKQFLPNGKYQVHDVESAVRMGTRLLGELTREISFRVHMEFLPGRILVKAPCCPEKIIIGNEVTEAIICGLLEEYVQDQISRLELDYGGHSLLFLRQEKEQTYACFWFCHYSQDWYGLVSRPEVYAEVSSEDVVRVPFGLGLLPNYLVHQSTGMIMNQLEEIFAQIACERPNPRMMMWAPQIYRFEIRQRYCLARRLYGGYPSDQAYNQITDRFYLPHLPVKMAFREPDGSASGSIEVLRDKAGVQFQLSRFMLGKLRQLALTWQYQPEGSDGTCTEDTRWYRHLILLKDQECYLMICLEDYKKTVNYLVADVHEYLDADEKRCRKESFYGQKIPGYLVHEDLRRIRDYLDLLLSEILYPSRILDQFSEFAFDGKVDYEKLKAEYLQ